MKQISVCLFFIFVLNLVVHAQDSVYIVEDSVFIKEPKLKLAFDIDQRFSLMKDENGNQQNVNIWGLRLGLLFPKQKLSYKIGLGYYFLSQSTLGLRLPTRRGDCADCYANRSLNFGTIFFEPFLYHRDLWELSIPIEFGYGKAQERYYNRNTELFRLNQDGEIFPMGAGVSFSFKFPPVKNLRALHWFGLNFLAGYRKVLSQNIVRQDYDGIFYSVGLNFFFDRIVDDVRAWRAKKNKKR